MLLLLTIKKTYLLMLLSKIHNFELKSTSTCSWTLKYNISSQIPLLSQIPHLWLQKQKHNTSLAPIQVIKSRKLREPRPVRSRIGKSAHWIPDPRRSETHHEPVIRKESSLISSKQKRFATRCRTHFFRDVTWEQ